MQKLIKSAIDRAEHFQNSISIYKTLLSNDSEFQKNFLHLLDTIVKTDPLEQNFKKLFLIAIGKSAGIARTAASMFVSVGLPVQFLHPTEALHGDFGVLGEQDTVVFISNGGNTQELLHLIPHLKERNIQIFTITSKTDSQLARKSDYVLKLPDVEEKCPLFQSPLTSTLTSLALCQLLVAASVEKRDFSIETYAKNHPGGSIGKRIFLKIDDLMTLGDQLPLIEPDAMFQKVVSIFTSFAKACLIVVDEHQNFLGLIAERDLRKAMENFGPDVFKKCALDFMNAKPIFIKSGELAINALKLMTSKKPYLNVLPVISEEGKAIGVIQIQDLLELGIKI